jgi:hypothetical protein
MHGPICIFWANITPLSLSLPDAQTFKKFVIFDEGASSDRQDGSGPLLLLHRWGQRPAARPLRR